MFLTQLKRFLSIPSLLCVFIVNWCGVLSNLFSRSLEMIKAVFCSVITVEKGHLLSEKCHPMSNAEDWSSDSELQAAWEILFLPPDFWLFVDCFHQLLFEHQMGLRPSPSRFSCFQSGWRKRKWEDKQECSNGLVADQVMGAGTEA